MTAACATRTETQLAVLVGFASVLAFAVAIYAAYSMKTDIQLGIVVTGFFAAWILWGII
jgi:hypothetical protein